MKALIIDFETTDATAEAQATEIGYMPVIFSEQGLIRDGSETVKTERCKPDVPISYGAMAVTHITNDDVANELSHKDVCTRIMQRVQPTLSVITLTLIYKWQPMQVLMLVNIKRFAH